MQKFTILVVDDDPAIRNLLNELLTSKPEYRVVLAGDSKEAVRAFYDERRIDVVLTDIHMPDHTGIEMMSDMKTMDFKPEILVMTANGTPENVEKSRKIGARSMILKPFDNLDVIETEIRKAIEAAAAKRGEEPQDEVTDSTPDAPAAAPTEEPTEELTQKLTQEATEELTEVPTDELAEELAEKLTKELTELAAGPARAATAEDAETTAGETAQEIPAVLAEEVAEKLTKELTKELAAGPTSAATAEDAETTAEETAQEIPAELESIFRVGTDLDAEGLKLQVPIVCLQTLEEQDAIDALRRLASELGRKLYAWSSTRGIVDGAGKVLGQAYVDPIRALGFRRLASELGRKLYAWFSTRGIVDGAGKVLGQAYVDPIQALGFIGRQELYGMFILADFGRYLDDPQIVRTLREMVMEGHTARAMVVLTAPRMIIPPELESSCALFEWPASKERDIEAVFEEVRKAVESSVGRPISLDADAREIILERLKGMSAGRVRFEIFRALMIKTRS